MYNVHVVAKCHVVVKLWKLSAMSKQICHSMADNVYYTVCTTSFDPPKHQATSIIVTLTMYKRVNVYTIIFTLSLLLYTGHG